MINIDVLTKKIIERYKENSVSLINMPEILIKIYYLEYIQIVFDPKNNSRNELMSMIVNPEVFKDSSKYLSEKDFESVRNEILESMIRATYINKYISESEYNNLCHTGN